MPVTALKTFFQFLTGDVEVLSDDQYKPTNDESSEEDIEFKDDDKEDRSFGISKLHLSTINPNADRQTRGTKKSQNDDKNATDKQPESKSGSPTPSADGSDQQSNSKFLSTRKYFHKDEDFYVMDAKSIGNIGRYLNHSCNPNVFVQNCFVDTHDLRFPWVAFFASTHITAGEELCWDYNYQVDQVAGKEIYCQCGADNCRGRLL